MKKSTVLPVVAALLVGAGFYVHANAGRGGADRPAVVTPNAPQRVAAEGRVVTYPGDEVTVGADFAGTVRSVRVKEKDVVKKGELLVELNADEESARLKEARARVAEADADIRLFDLEVERAERLLVGKVGSPQALDKARRDREAATARRATASAEADRLTAVIAKSRITAPISGVVLRRHVEAGETVARGAPAVSIANLSRLRIEAEVDEADSARVTLHAPVTIRVEGEPDVAWKGEVEEIPDAVTTRRLKPQDPGRPSDTRVLLVKVAARETMPLKLGRRVEVDIQAPSAR